MVLNSEDLMDERLIDVSLGHGEHEVIEFKISVDSSKTATTISILDVGWADIMLFRELVSKIFPGKQLLKALDSIRAKHFLSTIS